MKIKDFIAGRYETSNITTTKGTAIKSVAGALPSNNINWYYMYAQQREYVNIKGLTVGSSMIQGAAYDQVMKFVNTATYGVKATTNAGHNFSSPYQTGGRNYTGTYKDTSKNIFDLEGNVRAWTTEASSTNSRVSRGGSYGYSYSASYRSNYYPYGTYSSVGAVAQLYVK